MGNTKQIPQTNTPSRLERFGLHFEYDKTLREIKREVHIRTIE